MKLDYTVYKLNLMEKVLSLCAKSEKRKRSRTPCSSFLTREEYRLGQYRQYALKWKEKRKMRKENIRLRSRCKSRHCHIIVIDIAIVPWFAPLIKSIESEQAKIRVLRG